MTSNRHPQRERPRTSRVSRLALVAALAWTLPARAPAQQTGTVEGGAFARYTDFDHSLALARSVGAGGRVGVFVRPNVAVELDLSSASATRAGGASVSHAPLHAWLVYSPSLNPRATLLFGGGIVRNRYGDAYRATDHGLAGFVGLRRRLNDRWLLRLDATEDFVTAPANATPQVTYNANFTIRAGLSTFLRRGGG